VKRPNILCIVTDQQRQDHLGCYGNAMLRTPHVDRLAAEGVRCDRHYVNNPLCMPSRASLFTGLTPRTHGVRTNGINLDRRWPVLPGMLRDAGYRTQVVGKLHLDCHASEVPGMRTEPDNDRAFAAGESAWGFDGGELSIGHGWNVRGAYQRWLAQQPGGSPSPWKSLVQRPELGEQCGDVEIPEELHHSSFVAERSIAFLRDRPADQPFFLWCSFPDPHHPYCPPPRHRELYPRDAIPLPPRRAGEFEQLPPHMRASYEGEQPFAGRPHAPTRMSDAQCREIIARTYGMVTLVDEQVGRILASLDELGLRDDTLVLFLSDHGDLLGDHALFNKGPFHFEGLLNVPFIARWPGVLPAGRHCSALTSHLDLVPTRLDCAGAEYPEVDAPPEPVCPRQRTPLPGRSLLGLLRGEVGDAGFRDALLVENDEDYIGQDLRTLITDRYKLTCYSHAPYGELFDLHEDPDELCNRWDDPEFAACKIDLQARLMRELLATASPLPRRIAHA